VASSASSLDPKLLRLNFSPPRVFVVNMSGRRFSSRRSLRVVDFHGCGRHPSMGHIYTSGGLHEAGQATEFS